MINALLINFNRNANIERNADLGEKIGNIGLGLLRIGFGKTVNVKKISNDSDQTIFTNNMHSMGTKVAAVALFILGLPLTIILAGIGYIGLTFSKSHKQFFKSYLQLNTAKRKPPKHVQFADAECRIFDHTRPAAEVGSLATIEFRSKKNNKVLQLRNIHL